MMETFLTVAETLGTVGGIAFLAMMASFAVQNMRERRAAAEYYRKYNIRRPG